MCYGRPIKFCALVLCYNFCLILVSFEGNVRTVLRCTHGEELLQIVTIESLFAMNVLALLNFQFVLFSK